MDLETWAHDVDVDTASSARMYDYYLGGSHNFTADRIAAAKVIAAMPRAPRIARANRSFLGRAVRYMLDHGVRQFIDLGSGIPTVGNVHEIAQRIAPETRVVYADIDPVAVTLSQRLLEHNDHVVAVRADLTQPKDVLTHPDVRGLLDLREPIGLLTVAVLHFVPDNLDPYGAIAWLRDRLAPGSYLALSQGIDVGFDADTARAVQGIYQTTSTPGLLRTREQIMAFFDGFDLVDPGLVDVSQWRPGIRDQVVERQEESGIVAGVGRIKPIE